MRAFDAYNHCDRGKAGLIFVIGGEFSGKSEYVKSNFNAELADGADASLDELQNAAAVKNFHLLVKKQIENGFDIKAETDWLLRVNPDIIIISNEIGCGVVPLNKEDREYREAVGRLNCYLAGRAERVIRVVCGIGQVIK